MPNDPLNKAFGTANDLLGLAADVLEDRQNLKDRQNKSYLRNSSNKDADDLRKYREENGKGSTPSWNCSPSMASDFSSRLTEGGIQNVRLKLPDGRILVVAKDSDKKKADAARDAIFKELNTLSKSSLDQLKRENVNGEILVVRNAQLSYATVVEEEAKRLGFKVARTDNKDGTFDIHYSKKDANKARQALMKAVVSTRGVIGRLNELRTAENARVSQEIYDNISDPQREFYVVSPYQPNEYMYFTPGGYQHYRDGKLLEDELRNNGNFQQDAHKRVDMSFSRPVVLTRDEFERVRELPAEKRREHITKNHTKTISLSQADAQRLQLEVLAGQKLLYEQKMAFYENNEYNSADTPATLDAFASHEEVTDAQLDRAADQRLAEDSSSRESLPSDVQALLEEFEKLPYEERLYADEFTKECADDLRRIEAETEIVEVTQEDLLKQDIDAVIAGLAGEKVTEQRTYETEERTL